MQRNHDEQAYRAWQADRSDHEALQRYLLSMDRGREVISEPEDVIDLESRIGFDDPLRQVYERVRPDYSDEAITFEEERWRTLVDRCAGRQIDPQAALILVEMGLQSKIPIHDVYRILHEKLLISNSVYQRIRTIQYSEVFN